jgi:hypothetical protein
MTKRTHISRPSVSPYEQSTYLVEFFEYFAESDTAFASEDRPDRTDLVYLAIQLNVVERRLEKESRWVHTPQSLIRDIGDLEVEQQVGLAVWQEGGVWLVDQPVDSRQIWLVGKVRGLPIVAFAGACAIRKVLMFRIEIEE